MRHTPLLAVALFLCGVPLLRAEETPPPGPPWQFDFVQAQRAAIAEGKPIFVYLTKTH